MDLAKECLWPASKPTASSCVVSVISDPLEEAEEEVLNEAPPSREPLEGEDGGERAEE
jgi:hypothetical protein